MPPGAASALAKGGTPWPDAPACPRRPRPRRPSAASPSPAAPRRPAGGSEGAETGVRRLARRRPHDRHRHAGQLDVRAHRGGGDLNGRCSRSPWSNPTGDRPARATSSSRRRRSGCPRASTPRRISRSGDRRRLQGTTELDGVAGLAGRAARPTTCRAPAGPTWTGEFVFLSWGSSTCVPVIEDVAASGPAEVTMTFETPTTTRCARWTWRRGRGRVRRRPRGRRSDVFAILERRRVRQHPHPDLRRATECARQPLHGHAQSHPSRRHRRTGSREPRARRAARPRRAADRSSPIPTSEPRGSTTAGMIGLVTLGARRAFRASPMRPSTPTASCTSSSRRRRPTSACTADLVPRVTLVGVPEDVDPEENLDDRGDRRRLLRRGRARGRRGPRPRRRDRLRAERRLGDRARAVRDPDWGSSTCVPVIEESRPPGPPRSPSPTRHPPDDQVCTMDMAPARARSPR